MQHKKAKRKFSVKNIPILADESSTENLVFEVYPNAEGLVGQCYHNKAIQLDDNLEETNSKDYKLNQSQISKTTNLRWSICCPVMDENSNVIAIIALDGTKRIKFKENKIKEMTDLLWTFSNQLYSAVPQLFKGRII